MPPKPHPPAPIYQLKVALLDISPSIWRRFEIRGDVTLNRLHRVLQRVMGWTESHLHLFAIDGIEYGPPDPDGELTHLDDRRAVLSKLVRRAGTSFTYEYDYGDYWMHEIAVEAIVEPDRHGAYPRCLAGARACPPEDVGGTGGYELFLEAIRDPENPEHDSWLTWAGGVFDPEGFDVNGVNRLLRRMR